MRNRLISILPGLAAAAFVSIAAAAAPVLPEQSSTDAGVSITVTPRELSGAAWTFDLVLVTHSGALDDDLAREAVLIADGGAPLPAIGWRGTPPGGHHRKGVLSFRGASPTPSVIELKIRRPGESSARVFRWQLH